MSWQKPGERIEFEGLREEGGEAVTRVEWGCGLRVLAHCPSPHACTPSCAHASHARTLGPDEPVLSLVGSLVLLLSLARLVTFLVWRRCLICLLSPGHRKCLDVGLDGRGGNQ